MVDELLDLVDKNDNVVGTVWRSNAHKNPDLLHREVGIILFNNKNEILLQQRSFNKKNSPGSWKITAAGHPMAGEDPEIAIKRELFEELGVNVNPVFYKKIFSTHNKIGENQESRFFWIYYAVLNRDPKIRIKKSEVNATEWVSLKEMKEFSQNHVYNLNGDFHKIITELALKLKII
jgi:isopentenyl-diphosphate delta-isomerase